MKKLKDFITEKQNFLITNKNVLNNYNEYDYHPKTYGELKDIIIELLENNITDLNCIDVSNITDFSWLFYKVKQKLKNRVIKFDVSQWDVSNAIDLSNMFRECHFFNCDLSNWDVSNVINMDNMFAYCNRFNSDLSNWDVSNVKTMKFLFQGCEVIDFDISKWNIKNNIKTTTALKFWMFHGCKKLREKNKIPEWYN